MNKCVRPKLVLTLRLKRMSSILNKHGELTENEMNEFAELDGLNIACINCMKGSPIVCFEKLGRV